MKNHKEELDKVESVTTIIVNIGTIVSWAITLITAMALMAQPQPIAIPGILELGKPYTLTFLVSILFGYLQVFRQFWRRSSRTKSDTESSFGTYLYASTAKLKRPFVLVGFALIIIPIAQIEPVGTSVISTLMCIFGGGYLLYLRMNEPEQFKWKFDDEFSRRWFKRIRNQLHDCGYVFTVDFDNLYVHEDEVNLAIEKYFDRYEFEQSLVLTKRAVRGLIEASYFLELRYDHLPSRLQEKSKS